MQRQWVVGQLYCPRRSDIGKTQVVIKKGDKIKAAWILKKKWLFRY